MTNYESAAYNVVDSNEDSITYETLPGRTTYTDDKDAVMKVWRTAFLPDGQPISIAVEHTLDDVRGLQSWLNDQFGRGQARIGAHAPADLPEPGEPYAVDPELIGTERHSGLEQYLGVPATPDYTPGPEVYAAQTGVLVDAANAAGYDVPPVRRCPHISNGVQCEYAEHDTTYPHSYEPTMPQFDGFQTVGDGPGPIPNNGYDPVLHAAEEQLEQEHPSEPAPAADEKPARKKSVRRKKEELEYDKALETFRSQPDSQLNYTDLVKAAEALRKRFPDAERLVAYDLHIQHQDVTYLTDPAKAGTGPIPSNTTPPAPAPEPAPHFAPEEPAAAQPTPFVPPVAMQPADVQSPEEVQAAAAFPCQFRSETSGRQCTRPAGHELADPPKPHIFAELQPGQNLPAVPNFIPSEPFQPGQPVGTPPSYEQPSGFTVTPVGEGSGFSQTTIPPFQIPQPQAQPAFTPPAAPGPVPGQQLLSFQVPPLPEGEQQPTAPAAPWGP